MSVKKKNPPGIGGRGAFDARLLAALEEQPVASVEELCRYLFPDLSWEECQKPRRWGDELGGILCSTAWLVHWRCRVLVRRQLIGQVRAIDTDQFVWQEPAGERPAERRQSSQRVGGRAPQRAPGKVP